MSETNKITGRCPHDHCKHASIATSVAQDGALHGVYTVRRERGPHGESGAVLDGISEAVDA